MYRSSLMENTIIFLVPSIKRNRNSIGAQIQKLASSTYSIYKEENFFNRILRKIHMTLHLPFFHIWYGEWKNHFSREKTIVLFDSLLDANIIQYISIINRKKNNRLIFWFWNPVREEYLKPLHENNWEIWTFDKSEADKYNLKYNTQFYFNSFQPKTNEIQNDVLFVGRDKGRGKYLHSLQQEFEKQGLISHFFISKDLKWYEKLVKPRNNFMAYQSVLDLIGTSRAILDIVQEGQTGLTLRPLEALFLNRKLITNNQDIENYDFYDKQNIFILGKDDLSKIAPFIHSPMKHIPQEVKNYYNFSEWLKRFGLA
jgi:hypothetical protein